MFGHVPKTKVFGTDAQAYLNEDAEGDKVYLQQGWLDAVAIGKPPADDNAAKPSVLQFEDFRNVLPVFAYDHTMVIAVIAVGE